MRQRRMIRFLWICSMLILLLRPSIAEAHAYIDQSTPVQESENKESPKQIRVTFSENINTTLSSVKLLDAAGNTIPGAQTGIGENGLILQIPPLKDGVYKVVWQVLSVDTHVTEGSFRFAVGVPLPKVRPAETQSLDDPEPANAPPTEEEKEKQVQPIVKAPAAAVTTAPSAPVRKEALTEPGKQPDLAAPKTELPAKQSGTSTATSSAPPSPSKQADASTTERQNKLGAAEQSKGAPGDGMPDTNIPISDNGASPAPAAEPPETKEEQQSAVTVEKSPAAALPASANESVPSAIHEHEQHAGNSAVHTRMRIIEILTASLVGGLVFLRLWRPYGQIMEESMIERASLERFLLLAAFILFLISGAGHVYGLADQLSGETLSVGNTVLTLLSSTLVGMASWLRPLLVLLLLLLTLWTPPGRDIGLQIGRVGIVVLIMLTFPLTGHAVATAQTSIVPILLHTVHFLVSAVWVGGLAGLTAASFTLGKGYSGVLHLHQAMIKFSRIAAISVGIVTLTGILLSFYRLKAINQLVESTYGSTLMIKIALFLVALALAGYHRYRLLPRITLLTQQGPGENQPLISSLFWSLRAELVAACAVLVAAGFLSTTAPPM